MIDNVVEDASRLRRRVVELETELEAHRERQQQSVNADELTLADLKVLEREIILRALSATNWKVYGTDGAAARLGLPPTTLASRMKKMDLRKPDGSNGSDHSF